MCLIHISFLHAQEVGFEKIESAFLSNDFVKTKELLTKIDTSAISQYDKATWFYYNADYNSKIDNHHLAYKNIILSKNLFLKLNKKEDVVDCNVLLLEILSYQENFKIKTDKIIQELESFAKAKPNSKALISIYGRVAYKYYELKDAINAITYYKKTISLCLKEKDTASIGKLYVNIAAVYNSVLKNKDSSLFYHKKAAPILIQYKDYQNLSYSYNNQGKTYKNQGEYSKAIQYYKKAEQIPLTKFVAKSKLIYYKNLSEVYQLNKEYQIANVYLNKYLKLKDSINIAKQDLSIEKYKKQFNNEKLRAENLLIEAEKNRIKYWLLLLVILLVFGSILSYLTYKNSLKKQKIIKTEKLVEQQRVASLLKAQEIIAIDAMLVGQEKERKQIAADLQDDLGALMATLQFNFENLYKHRDSENAEELFIRTKKLIKGAYKKIRSIAHVKNSGVIAKQGLLKSVNVNAKKTGNLHNIKIDVIAHGLINRLENQLELVLFRVIQELITNIVKHSGATEADIHLTNHNDFLNIMVEDNGKGFDISKLSKSEGMGIKNIEKRIESIGGTVIIESFIEKGTAVIIDVPI